MIYIGSDHRGTSIKEFIYDYLVHKNLDVKDVGTYSEDSCDYPDIVKRMMKYFNREKDKGILLCHTANGMSMSANKYLSIRAALCWKNQIAELSRKHNDANVLCLPTGFLNKEEVLEIIDTFLNTEFEGGRHFNRITKIDF